MVMELGPVTLELQGKLYAEMEWAVCSLTDPRRTDVFLYVYPPNLLPELDPGHLEVGIPLNTKIIFQRIPGYLLLTALARPQLPYYHQSSYRFHLLGPFSQAEPPLSTPLRNELQVGWRGAAG